jgi:hypothetical protein
MRRKLCFAVLVALVLFSVNAFADTVAGTSSGGWRAWTITDVNQNRTPYWDGNSYDSGNSYNIGNYLTNTGGFSSGSGPGIAYNYWGTATGGSDLFSMDWASGSNNVAIMIVKGTMFFFQGPRLQVLLLYSHLQRITFSI